MRVTAAHFRTIEGFSKTPGFCASGGRAWFKRHRLSFSDFLKNGIEADVLLRTGDAFAIAIVEHAKRSHDHGR